MLHRADSVTAGVAACRLMSRLLGCQVSNGFDRSFDASRPWMSATDAHAIAKILSVGREDATRSDGDPVLVERAGGESGGVEF